MEINNFNNILNVQIVLKNNKMISYIIDIYMIDIINNLKHLKVILCSTL